MVDRDMRAAELADSINMESRKMKYSNMAINMTAKTVNNRLNGKTPWMILEALLVCDALHITITRESLLKYFADSTEGVGPSVKTKSRGRPTLASQREAAEL